MKWKVAVAALALVCLCARANAADDASCRNVRFADVGWSDIVASTALASVVLEAIGYTPSVTVASIPVALTGLKNKQIDVLTGYWHPAMDAMMQPYVAAGQIKVMDQPNLEGARYSLAVPQYLFDRGLKTFADIARFQKELQGKIHGIEPGNEGNALIRGMIRDNRFGLQNFQLIESSETAMLVEARSAARSRKPIVFLAWEPHPMNVQIKMRYLSGGDDVFGPNLGEAKVYTAIATPYPARCPNAATFLKNLQFSSDMESQVMAAILEGARPAVAARNVLKTRLAAVDPWLRGVTTFDGRDALPEAMSALKR